MRQLNSEHSKEKNSIHRLACIVLEGSSMPFRHEEEKVR